VIAVIPPDRNFVEQQEDFCSGHGDCGYVTMWLTGVGICLKPFLYSAVENYKMAVHTAVSDAGRCIVGLMVMVQWNSFNPAATGQVRYGVRLG
jgi:hypothetical protein